MSVTYVTPRHQGTDSGEEQVEFDALLDGQEPAAVRIESYIPAKKRTILFDTGILLVVLLIFALTAGLVGYFATRETGTSHSSTRGWINAYSHAGSESVMRLIDVNGDGCDDAIFGLAQPSTQPTLIYQAPYCKQYTQGCLASVLAVDGRTGDEIWNISTYNEIFELNCGNIDIDKDGKMDCLGAGRRGSYTAFNPYNGQLLWHPQNGSESYIAYQWNIYNPLVINDVTNDGVQEVLLAHGGDPDFSADNTTRYPGRLLLLDGATGHLIGRYLEMPDRKETYNSPVLHTDKREVKYVVLGTGGETVPGGLYIARLDDLVQHIKSPETQTSEKRMKGLTLVDNGPFYSIFESHRKGVMVPVVLADLNHDGCADLIVSSFDGVLSAYDGETFNTLWTYEDKLAESYTTPGLGYFNNDKHLDLMMHWNYGIWPDYNKSVVVIHSGVDGRPLWLFNTIRFSMTSDLVIQTGKSYQDMFVFRVQGRAGDPVDTGVGVVHGIDPQRNLQRNKSNGQSAKLCDLTNYDILASEVFIVNWQTRDSPRRVFRRDVDKYYFDLTTELEKSKDHTRATQQNTHIKAHKSSRRCAIMEQSSRTTGAIGDINNDNMLDLVLTFNAQGIIKDSLGNPLRSESSLDLVAIELEAKYQQYPVLKDKLKIVNSSSVPRVSWKSRKSQKWIGYMGADSLSRYKG